MNTKRAVSLFITSQKSLKYQQSGFTLVELVAVIIVMAILAVTVAPKFIGRDNYDAYTYRSQLISSLRLTQQRAMQNQRPNICHQFLIDTFNGNMQAGVPDNNACGASPEFTQSAESNGDLTRVEVDTRDYATFTLNGDDEAALTFDSLGRPSGDCVTEINLGFFTTTVPGCTITVTSLETASLCIESEGYIHNIEAGQQCPQL